jgi:hypothetical protein
LRFEEAGDLDDARTRWRELEKHKDAAEAEQRLWSLLASKRLRELQAVDDREDQWRSRIERERMEAHEPKYDNEAEERVARAIRAEMFGDPGLALEYWRTLKATYDKDLAQRTWLLLAAQKVRALTVQAPRGSEGKKVRRELLQQKLDQAAKEDRIGEAKAVCRDIIFLYDKSDDDEVRIRVSEARDLLAKLTPKTT